MAEQITEEMKKCEQAYNQALTNNEIEKAIELCEKLVFEYDWFGYKQILAELYNKVGNFEKTISYVQSLIDNPEIGEILLANLMPNTLMQQGFAYRKLKRYDDAISSYSTVVQQNLNKINKYPNAADIDNTKLIVGINFFSMGETYFEKGDYTNAYESFKNSEKYAKLVGPIYYYGLMYQKGRGVAKNIDLAIKYFESLPENPLPIFSPEEKEYIIQANYILGKIYSSVIGRKDKEKAFKRLKKAQMLGYKISDGEINSIIQSMGGKESVQSTPDKYEAPKNSSSGGCYVATCVYGSYDCPPVWTLRRFRDNILSNSMLGRLFIKAYYATSPTAVRFFGNKKWFHRLFKAPLDRLVKKLQDNGVESTPYND